MAKDRRSLIKRTQDAYQDMLRLGRNKHQDSPEVQKKYIYGITTMKNYLRHGLEAMTEIRKEYSCRTLEEAKEHVPWYLNKLIDSGNYSASTINLIASALSKLYQCSNPDWGVNLPTRRKEDIRRSRGAAVRDKNFSEERNLELVTVCKTTGLRRSELEKMKGSDLFKSEDGHYYVKTVGKGGKYRESRVVGTREEIKLVVDRAKASGNGLMFSRVHSACDVHAYRAEYADRVYRQYARAYEDIPRKDRYYCRGDKAGVCYDKKALLVASRALGHNRTDVVAVNYLR